MNKELELEAEKYANDWEEIYPELDYGKITPIEASKIDFIAGATSKYVEKQKLEFAIEQYKIIKKNEYCPFPLFTFCNEKIKELEQKLSEL